MSDPTHNSEGAASSAPSTPTTPWSFTLAAVRRRWPKALVRVTMLAESGPEAFLAAVVRTTATGPGAEEAPVAFGGSDVEALRELVKGLQGRAPGAGGSAGRPSP